MTLSIRTYLLILVAALSLPLAGAIGYGIYSDRHNSIAQTRLSLRTLSTIIATHTTRQINDARNTLERLALRPLVRALDRRRCDELIRELQSLRPDYVNIVSADLKGDIVCSAVPFPPERIVNIADRPWFRTLMESKAFTVGAPHLSQIAGRKVTSLSVPILGAREELIGSAHLLLDLDAFDPQMPTGQLPAESRYGVFHADGTIIWRNLDPENLIGTRPDSDAARSIVSVRNGEFESAAVDGVARFFAVTEVADLGLVAYVAVPASALTAEVRRRTLVSMLLGLVGLLILLSQARTIARRIERPIQSLLATARSIHSGKNDARAEPSGPQELSAVAKEFNAMIDARLADERELRASEERLYAFLDNSAVIAWLKDDVDRFVFANNNFLARFKLDTTELIGRTADQIWPAEIARNFSVGNPAAMASGTEAPASQETVEMAINPDGSRSWWHKHEFVFSDTAHNRLVGTLAVDITEREAVRSELLESSTLSEQIFNSAQEGIVVYGADLHYRIWNPYMARFTGMDADQVLGRHPLDVFPFLGDSGIIDKLYAALEGKIAEPVEFPFTVKQSGRSGWAQDRTAPLFNSRGEVIGVIATVSDITARVEAESRLRELNETLEARVDRRTAALEAARQEAERLSRIKSEFLANMSHEIRTPLNGVLGMAQLGHRNSQNDPASRQTFEQIINSGKLLLGVINDVLDFSKIDAGKLHLSLQPTDPSAAMTHALALVADAARAKAIALQIECAPDFPAACLIDGLRLEQILVNLLSNAVKFTEAGTVVLQAARTGDRMQFRIVDTGLGMDAEQISRLFRPFEQADSSTTRRFGGTGLGLAIVGRLVELMGGSITVDSRPGHGSTFTVELPLTELAREALADPALAPLWSNAAAPRLSGLRILIAEDNEVNQTVIEGILRAEGAEPSLASDGRQAVERATGTGAPPFDLVLMDIQMPLMNGYEAARQILRQRPDLPIVALTAHALAEEREHCLDAGMVDQATKPIEPEQLVSIILRATGRLSRTVPDTSAATPARALDAGHVDWCALDASFAQTPGMAARVLESFCRTNAGRPAQLRAAAQSGDWPAIVVHAHGLKSAFGFLKAADSMALARTLEHAAQEAEADPQQLAALAEQLAAEIETVIGEIGQRASR